MSQHNDSPRFFPNPFASEFCEFFKCRTQRCQAKYIIGQPSPSSLVQPGFLRVCEDDAISIVSQLPPELLEHVPELKAVEGQVSALEVAKNGAYTERNKCVALIAQMALAIGLTAGIGRHPAEDASWDDDWRNIIFIDLPAKFGPIVTHELRRQNNYKGHQKGELICTYQLSEEDSDLAEITWSLHDAGYLKRQDHLGEPIGYMHRIVAERMFGEIPEGYEVDHIDGNGLNDSRQNIRLATSFAQKLNQDRAGTSVRQKQNGKWQALWGTPQQSLGCFDTEEEARESAKQHHEGLVELAHKKGEYIYPTVQCSWHIHDSELPLFSFLPEYTGQWDGHDTTEKYRRVLEPKLEARPKSTGPVSDVPVPDFQCPYCDQPPFSARGPRTNHIKAKHPGMPIPE